MFSSNYTLYGDMSQRVMTTLENLAPKVDVYSIDEAFLDLTGIDRVVSFEEFGRDVKNTVYQDIGLPVCVGIAPTRTLAKLANYAARKYTATGRKLSARLQAMGIVTALQLADTHQATLRKQFSVVLERTAQELNGIPCVPWEDVPAPKKQIMCSRSFGRPLQKLSDLEEAVAHFATRAAGKLRAGE